MMTTMNEMPRETYPSWPLPSLRAWRNYRLLGQAELARKAGVTPQTVMRLERGSDAGGTATRATIRKLAKALGCKPDDLLAEPAAD